jgi:transcriptional regulator with XRE-family HTH domain
MDPHEAEVLRVISPVELGRRIRQRRTAAGLSQVQLGTAAQVTGSYISRIEAGTRKPDAVLLERLAASMNVHVDELLGRVDLEDDTENQLDADWVELALETGECSEALARVEELLTRGIDPGSSVNLRARLLHARALEANGRIDEAIEAYSSLLREDRNGSYALACGIALSRCYREIGDFGRAVATGTNLLERLGERGLSGTDEAVQLTVTVAAACYQQGDIHSAVRLCRDSIAAAEQTGSPQARAAAYWNASMMENEQGATGHAVTLAQRALALLGEGRDTRNLARLRTQLGVMQLQLQPPALKEASKNLERAAKELSESSASTIDFIRNRVARARAKYLAGDVAVARVEARHGYEASKEVAPLLAADARALEGQAAAAEGDLTEAKALFKEAVLMLTGVGADRSAAQLWLELGGLLQSVGEEQAASEAYRSAAVSTGLTARHALQPSVTTPRLATGMAGKQ